MADEIQRQLAPATASACAFFDNFRSCDSLSCWSYLYQRPLPMSYLRRCRQLSLVTASIICYFTSEFLFFFNNAAVRHQLNTAIFFFSSKSLNNVSGSKLRLLDAHLTVPRSIPIIGKVQQKYRSGFQVSRSAGYCVLSLCQPVFHGSLSGNALRRHRVARALSICGCRDQPTFAQRFASKLHSPDLELFAALRPWDTSIDNAIRGQDPFRRWSFALNRSFSNTTLPGSLAPARMRRSSCCAVYRYLLAGIDRPMDTPLLLLAPAAR